MKAFRNTILTVAAAAAMLGIGSCQDDFSGHIPGFQIPEADHQANMSIFDFKKLYWDDATNYIDTIGYLPGAEDAKEHIYIAGRVVSTDIDGNVFKSLVIQDKTAALAISINQYDLYLQYRIGQEIVIDATNMYIGKYNGLQQLGLPEWYESGSVWEASFMPLEFFKMHAQLNGIPEPAKVDTLNINNFDELDGSVDGLVRLQSRIVKFNNVYFEDANGTTVFSEYKSSGVNHNIVDVKGNVLPVRTSGYSTFWNTPLPEGNGDVVAILSYYGTTGWQLLLNGLDGCMNFGNPTVAPGTDTNPYTVDQAIEVEKGGATERGWVEGYIVGAVAPGIDNEHPVTSNADIEWGADVTLPITLVIGQSADTKDIANALVVELPEGSALREYGNLADNPDNYGKHILIYGALQQVFGTYGIAENSGDKSLWKIDGVTVNDGSIPEGDGTETSPYNSIQVYKMNPTSTTEAVKTGVYVEGYIVGYMPSASTYLDKTVFAASADINTNIVIGPTADCTDYTQCIGVQLPKGAIRDALNLQSNPGNFGKKVLVCGDVMKYCGGPGIKNTSKGELVDGGTTPDVPVTPPAEEAGDGTANNPYNIARANAIIAAGTYTDTEVYIKGKVSKIDDIGNNFGNATYYLSDDGTTANQLEIFRGYGLNGDKISSADYIKLGDELVILGKLVMYGGTTPEVTTGSKMISINGSGSTPDTPDVPTDGGTEDNPFTCANVIALDPTSTQEAVAGGSGVWVEGYIVGYMPATGGTYLNKAVFGAPADGATNLVLAPTADCTDYTQCIGVQLPKNDVRTALNLQDNAGNLGKKVLLYGDVMKYCGGPGLKNTSKYKFVD